MDAITVSAKFAAYIWYTEAVPGKRNAQREALRFADANWERFLAHADNGLGRLLIRLSQTRPTAKGRRVGRKPSPRVATIST